MSLIDKRKIRPRDAISILNSNKRVVWSINNFENRVGKLSPLLLYFGDMNVYCKTHDFKSKQTQAQISVLLLFSVKSLHKVFPQSLSFLIYKMGTIKPI